MLAAQLLVLLAVDHAHAYHTLQRGGRLLQLGCQTAAVAAPRRVELQQPRPAVAAAGEAGLVQLLDVGLGAVIQVGLGRRLLLLLAACGSGDEQPVSGTAARWTSLPAARWTCLCAARRTCLRADMAQACAGAATVPCQLCTVHSRCGQVQSESK